MTIEVLLEHKTESLDQTFTYHVPEYLEQDILVGKRVTVSFGHQILEGFVLEAWPIDRPVSYPLKDIVSVVDIEPVLNAELLALGRYMKKRTFASLSSIYQTMLPNALKAKNGRNIKKKYETYVTLTYPIEQILPQLKTDKQKAIVEACQTRMLKKEIKQISVSAYQTLLSKGFLTEEQQELYRLPVKSTVQESKRQLTAEQYHVWEVILQSLNQFQPFLLHGVTGSGKTEVYMQLIEVVVNRGKEAIVLVPEISLTPQIVEQFQKRFGERVAILHSRLSNGEKYDEWRKILRKEVSIVIGARSAIFAPLSHLGMIIIDEEHSTSYYQENQPHYHAIDVALWRAKKHNCPVVLGSATPSIESYTRAQLNVYQLLTLTKRIASSLPDVYLIDMKEEMKDGNMVLSLPLQKAIAEALKAGQQVLLLLNRRGYTTVITCHKCGFTDKCPNCDIPLTYHKETGQMMCHYCEYHRAKIFTCPNCKSNDINEFGMGTEKLVEFVQDQFQAARILRMDFDTTLRKGSHEKMVTDFQNGKYDILIGTQMIAKGLNFPNVTTVGVLNCDASLMVPDFRSAERTFQLLTQTAGRGGRGHMRGTVYMQGFNIDHYSIKMASLHDYTGFLNQELKIRKQLNYPPYCNLSVLRFSGKEEEKVKAASEKVYIYLKKNLPKTVMILGPSPGSMPKINQKYYMQVMLKYKKTESIISCLQFLNQQYQKNRDCRLEIDLNPMK